MRDGRVGAQADGASARSRHLPAPARGARPRGLVAGRDAVRGLPRGDPDTEHRVDERGEGAGVLRAAGRLSYRGAAASAGLRATGAAHPARPGTSGSRRGGCARSWLPRTRVRRPGGGHGVPRIRGLCGEAAGVRRHRPGDRGLDRSLRRRACRSSSSTPTRGGSSRAWASCGARGYDDDPALLHRRLPRGCRALQRLPRADRPPGARTYCRTSPLRRPARSRGLSPKRGYDRADPLMRRSLLGFLLVASALPCRAPAAQDFWKHWGDGKAEMNGYRLTQPRYGASAARHGRLIFVTEDFSDTPAGQGRSRQAPAVGRLSRS